MEILYFGTLCSQAFEDKIVKQTKNTGNVAQNNLERALIKGLEEEKEFKFRARCLPCLPYESLNNDKIINSFYDQVSSRFKTKTYTVIKIPGIKYISYFFETIFQLLKWNKKIKKKKRVIFVTVNFIPVTAAILALKKVLGYKTVAMVSDLSRDLYADARISRMSFFKRIIIPAYARLGEKIENSYDAYIFLSEGMNYINKKNQPYIIMEGIYNDNQKMDIENPFSEDTLIYAGALNEKYGIDKILEVVNKIKNPKMKLEIYGDGPCKNLVLEASKKDERIKYCGFVSRDELFKRMKNAKLLLNLRNPKLEYTKYSFPSKMFEYMASGVPVITTRLEGIPKEYYQYTFAVDSYNTEEIAENIERILKMDPQSLRLKGKAAQEFILSEKTYRTQAQKVAKLLKKIEV